MYISSVLFVYSKGNKTADSIVEMALDKVSVSQTKLWREAVVHLKSLTSSSLSD